MKTKTINVYSYAELSDKAKERAWLDSLQHFEYAWADDNAASLKGFENTFPLKIKHWEYGGRGEGVNFEMTCDDAVTLLTGQRLATYIWNNFRNDIYKGKFYSTSGNYVDGKYSYKSRHSKIILESSCPFTGYCMDDALLDEVFAFMEKPDSRNFEELMGDCFEAWVKACNDDADYQSSQPAFAESCEANEYEFDESGDML